MSDLLKDAFRELDFLTEDVFDTSSDGLQQLQDFNDEEEEAPITIIDIEAETEDELKDSYIGNVILECAVCKTKIYKDPKDVVVDEEEGLANMDEECPYCFNTSGYKVIGQVAPYSEVDAKSTEEDTDVTVDGDEVEVEEEDKEKVEEGLLDSPAEKISKGIKSVASNLGLTDELQTDEDEDEEILTEDLASFVKWLGAHKNQLNAVKNSASGILNIVHKALKDDSFKDNEKVQKLVAKWDTIKDSAKLLAEIFKVADNKTVTESFDNVSIDLDDAEISIKSKTPANDFGGESKDEVIKPISDELEAEISNNTAEDDEEDTEEVEEPIEDFDEEEFDRLGESYLKKVYENVNSFKTTSVKENHNNLIVEGMIKFKSGSSKPTRFVFTPDTITSKGAVRFLGENLSIVDTRTRKTKPFTLTGSLNKGKFIAESLNYNYAIKGTDNKYHYVRG